MDDLEDATRVEELCRQMQQQQAENVRLQADLSDYIEANDRLTVERDTARHELAEKDKLLQRLVGDAAAEQSDDRDENKGRIVQYMSELNHTMLSVVSRMNKKEA